MISKDDYHFKNWSYVFMNEFEAGNYDKLYVTVQPGVLTIYSNIVGFKGLYYAQDKLGLVKAHDEDFELLLHSAQKLPKILLIVAVIVTIAFVLRKLTNDKFTFLFIVLLGTEPYIIGQARVIQTDAIPMYLGFLALLIFYNNRSRLENNPYKIFLVGILSGLCVLEKSLYFVLVASITCEILFRITLDKNRGGYLKELVVFLISFFITLVLLFPAFWGNFLFTFYRITLGAFIFGVEGYDTETFSFAVTHHIKPMNYYFGFLLNKVSEFVWVGIILVVFNYKKVYKVFLTKGSLLLFYPVILFLVLLISEKKIGRYLVALYPYMILFATLGYYKILNTKKAYILIIFIVLTVRLVHFSYYFPDFLMYQNPLSIDRSFNNSDEAWGSGRKKLARYITSRYGQDNIIYAGDPTTLNMFYSGEVINKNKYTCGGEKSLIVTSSPEETLCGKKIEPMDSYSPYKDLKFYIYDSIKYGVE